MNDHASPAAFDRTTSAGRSGTRISGMPETLRNAILKTARASEIFRIVLPDSGDAAAVLEARPILASVAADIAEATATLIGTIDGAAFHLSVPTAALATWVERHLAPLAWDGLDEIARASVLDYLFADVIDLMENRAGKPIRLDRVCATGPAETVRANFGFMLRLDGMEVLAAGSFDERTLDGLTHWASRLPRHVVRDLPLRLSIRRGFCVLTLDELRHLGVGDGLVFENQDRSAGYVVAGETLGAPCRFEPGRAVLLGPLHRSPIGLGRSWMSSAVAPADVAIDPIEGATGSIPIPVVFDVGRLEMTVDQLNALGEGHVFVLDRFPRSLVEIVVHGKIIGRGEIIEHDALLAVRVTSLVT